MPKHFDALGYEISVGTKVLCGYFDLPAGGDVATIEQFCDGEVYVCGTKVSRGKNVVWWRYVKLERIMVMI